MNASFRRMHFALGSIALVALAAGCAKETKRPAQQPVGRTPTFESQLPPGEETSRPGRPEAAPRPGTGLSHPGTGAHPGTGMNGERGDEMAAQMTERQLCDELARRASLSATNVPGGTQIRMVPRSESEEMTVRMLARHVDDHLNALEQSESQPSEDPSMRCSLFDITRMGARGRVVEGPDGIAIVFTSEDPVGVSNARQQAQMFVQSVHR